MATQCRSCRDLAPRPRFRGGSGGEWEALEEEEGGAHGLSSFDDLWGLSAAGPALAEAMAAGEEEDSAVVFVAIAEAVM